MIITRLEDLHDSNFFYSVFWRTFLQWFGNSEEGGWLVHPFSPQAEKVTLRSYLRLLNFKANHRKIAIVDSGDEMATMVSSANPHGGSSLHSNIALVVRGPIWISVYEAETAVAKMSGGRLSDFSVPPVRPSRPGSAGVRILTENQIKDVLLERIEAASSGDAIRSAQFYLADRDSLDGLAAASGEGVDIKLLLDPNKDAFGYEKIGIPNRQAGHELVRRSNQRIELRWYDTHGEQFHTKLFMHESGGTMNVILGSANLTRRNLDNFNLELDVELTIDAASDTARAFIDYFERIWTNKGGRYTLSKESFEDDSQLKRVLYRIQERFGLSTF
ncbi:MAG: phospholipase [Desulfobulbaceae bacterium]|nr:MAG: phospholipase [Desulfobulbaceae bacterium]